MMLIQRSIWRIIRRAQFPSMRRDYPVGLIRNGSLKRVAECACCGRTISWCAKWRTPVRVMDFYAEHNDIKHVLQSMQFNGSMAGLADFNQSLGSVVAE
jgi:hypothetical protein